LGEATVMKNMQHGVLEMKVGCCPFENVYLFPNIGLEEMEKSVKYSSEVS
jgi:hypothetical protein